MRFISSGVLVGHKNYVILQYNITLRIRESLKFCEVFKLGRLNTIPAGRFGVKPKYKQSLHFLSYLNSTLSFFWD